MSRYLLRVIAGLAVWLASAPFVHAQTVVEYIHTDALGTPVAVTNSAGAVIERSVYEPYGQLINRPLTDGPGFTGHVQDATTGLTYMQQRYYDPQVGLFLSVDPVTAYESGTGQFNRYRYANNSPYRYSDPDGRIGLPSMFPGCYGGPFCDKYKQVGRGCEIWCVGKDQKSERPSGKYVHRETMQKKVSEWRDPATPEKMAAGALSATAQALVLARLKLKGLPVDAAMGAADSLLETQTRVRTTTVDVSDWKGTIKFGLFGDVQSVDFQGLSNRRQETIQVERQDRVIYGNNEIFRSGWYSIFIPGNEDAFMSGDQLPLNDTPK